MKKLFVSLLLVLALLVSAVGVFAEGDEANATELDASNYIGLEKGSKGDEVKALQTRLFELGYYNIAIDGDYGNGTVKAIQEFEEFNGMEQTGIATPEFQAFLFSDNAVAKPVAVSSIKVLNNNPIALVGGTLDMAEVVTVNPENATEKGLTYEVDSTEFAEIDENGILTAKERGDVTVTVTSKEDIEKPKTTTVKVKVRQPSQTLSLNESIVNLGKGSSYQLEAVVGPENADDKTVVWATEDDNVATVSSKGNVTAKGCGECDIICTTNDGSGVTASCHIVVTQLVTSMKFADSKVILPLGETCDAGVTILPEDATNKEVEWTTSDSTIVSVASDGKITAVSGGDCEITCTSTDGSEKQATLKVHVPTFSVEQTEYTVTSKSGLGIPVSIIGNYQIDASSSASCFDFRWSGNTLMIDPIKAGNGTIALTNSEAKEDKITLKITVDHSAVYDSTSYPKVAYDTVLRDPSTYKGENCSIYGKVLQKSEGWSSTVLRVGTGGYGYYDKVFWVEYTSSAVTTNVIEDDYITVYGTCSGTHTYTTVMGASVTIPAIDADKIIIGRK